MSRDTKRTWSQQIEEIDGEIDMGDSNISKPDSRENSSSRKKSKPNTDKNNKPKKGVELETDPVILQRRQKQIDYGKNTVGYANYTQQVTMEQRTKEHPKTPDKYTKYSRRAWDMLIKIWRKKLHGFDTEINNGTNTTSTDDDIDVCDDDFENICELLDDGIVDDENNGNNHEGNEQCVDTE